MSLPSSDLRPSRHPLECMVDRVKWLQTVPPPGPSEEDDGVYVIDKLLVTAGWSLTGETNVLQLCSLQTPVAEINNPDSSPSLKEIGEYEHDGKVTDITVVSSPSTVAILAGSSNGHVSMLNVKVPDSSGDETLYLQVNCNGEEFNGAEALPTLSPTPLHEGAVAGIDVSPETQVMVSVGEDGSICTSDALNASHAALQWKKPADGSSFSGVKWISVNTFATTGTQSGMQKWDTRQSETKGPVWSWPQLWGSKYSGMDELMREGCRAITCLDVLHSRPHMLAAGSKSGLVTIWDMRKEDQPLQATVPVSHRGTPVWEVKFDHLERWSRSTSSAPLPTVLACGEGGQMAVISSNRGASSNGFGNMENWNSNIGGVGPTASVIHQEPYTAIHGFDVDISTGQDLVFCAEGECLGFIQQPSL